MKIRTKMRALLFVFSIAVLSVSCNQKNTNPDQESVEDSIQEIPALTVSTFEAEAANYVDKEVALSGLVDHVCKHGGKKLLLVADGAKVHVEADTRFEDDLIGQNVSLNGIVRELRIDEAYCLQMEEDNINKHKEGETNEEDFTHKQQMIQTYRDSMATAGIDHLSYYSLDFLAFNKEL